MHEKYPKFKDQVYTIMKLLREKCNFKIMFIKI